MDELRNFEIGVKIVTDINPKPIPGLLRCGENEFILLLIFLNVSATNATILISNLVQFNYFHLSTCVTLCSLQGVSKIQLSVKSFYCRFLHYSIKSFS